MNPRIMFLVPTDYDSLLAKSVTHLIIERDENGFFERVVTLHPITRKTQVIEINDVHLIVEIGTDLLPGSQNYKLLRYIQLPIHFIRIIVIGYQLIKKERLNLIRANDPYWMGFIGLILAKLTSTPLCVSIHADYNKSFELNGKLGAPTILGSRILAKKLQRIVFYHANMILPIRETLGIQAVIDGANEEKIRVIPHGIDITPFKQDAVHNVIELLGLDSSKNILSFVGRLSKENYIDDMLEFARRLKNIRDDFILVMAGGGNEEQRISEIVQKDPLLNNSVKLLGFQPREICLSLRRVSTINLCLMGGFSLIEACAAARPVIAYNVAWHNELINFQTGCLIEEHDIDNLIKSACFLMDHPREAEKMGQNAQNTVFQKHDIKLTSDIKKNCYSELITSRHFFK